MVCRKYYLKFIYEDLVSYTANVKVNLFALISRITNVYTHKMFCSISSYVQEHIFEWLNLVTQHKKASNHHGNLPLEMYSFTS